MRSGLEHSSHAERRQLIASVLAIVLASAGVTVLLSIWFATSTAVIVVASGVIAAFTALHFVTRPVFNARDRALERLPTERWYPDTAVVDDPEDPSFKRITEAIRALPGKKPPTNWQDEVLRRVDLKAARRKQ